VDGRDSFSSRTGARGQEVLLSRGDSESDHILSECISLCVPLLNSLARNHVHFDSQTAMVAFQLFFVITLLISTISSFQRASKGIIVR
jgi:hypothetical protein